MIKSLIYRLASFAGAPRLMQRALVGDSAAILMYHAVTEPPLAVADWCFIERRHFADQMQYLQRHCRVVPLREIARALATPSARPTVALTFDDGFQNNCAIAVPILQELGLPATIFLATDFIDSDDTPWFCRINDALSRTSSAKIAWDGHAYDLSTPRLRAQANAALQARLKRLKHPELLKATRELVLTLGDHPGKPIPRGSPYRMLESHEIRAMANSRLIDFGAHTCSHAILSGLTNPERRREITDSLSAVERLTDAPCSLFAYPNGRAQDYGALDVAVLRGRNVSAAVTTTEGPNYPSGGELEMRRYGVGADASLAKFKLLTHHVLWKLWH